MTDYDRIARVIRYLDVHRGEQPPLEDLARVAGLSSAYFHRLFQRWAGVTPKDFLQCLTAEFARAQLRASHSVLDAALDSGLSGPGRLHDLMVSIDAATPGEIKSGGANLVIEHGVAPSPFGVCFLAWTGRGICRLAFGEEDAIDGLAEDWPAATLRANPAEAAALAERVFSRGNGGELRTFVRGSEFQVKVWRALLRIPSGATATYAAVAEAVGKPDAARAVGGACGANPVAWIIPCHRVIRATSLAQAYRWGAERKRVILGWEAARAAGGSRGTDRGAP